MKLQLQKLNQETLEKINSIQSLALLEELEMQIFGRKNGELTELLKQLKDLPLEEKKIAGQVSNEVKQALEQAFQDKKKELNAGVWAKQLESERIDFTQPALPKKEFGHLHPSTIIQQDLEDFFLSMGFSIGDGPELESEFYNFTAVNIPENHPARDMQDTFYIKDHAGWVMRTHTSSVQVRAMQKYGTPLRMIVPGKCFRNEATDVRHEHTFYQLEGVVIDKNITFAHLKGVLEMTVKHLFGEVAELRLRPKFYPFVEPGVNGEVTCFVCKGKGCRLCKNSGWLEVLGAGMIHPNVLKAGNIDPNVYSGFAFGFGLTRLVMLKYGIEDIRLLESGDMRFLEQF